MAKFKITCTLEANDTVTDTQIRSYAYAALSAWGGSLCPPYGFFDGEELEGDPMFGFHQVTHLKVFQSPRGRKIPLDTTRY